MLRQPIHSILNIAQADRPNTTRSWLLALIAAGQAALSTLILIFLYRFAGWHEVLWAVISAVLVVQPGFRQSLTSLVTRVIANIVGACTGLVVGLLIKDPTAAVVLALVIVILLCELWRLDVGVRPACASVIIVMMFGEGHLLGSSLNRVVAVAIGCTIAVLVQLLTVPLVRRV
jgi:uncharacterized membrane protein YgaE (UPF0421/DUF939 family)